MKILLQWPLLVKHIPFFSSTDISEQEPNMGGENKRSAMLILYFCVLIMGGLVQKGAGQLQELFFSFGGEHP